MRRRRETGRVHHPGSSWTKEIKRSWPGASTGRYYALSMPIQCGKTETLFNIMKYYKKELYKSAFSPRHFLVYTPNPIFKDEKDNFKTNTNLKGGKTMKNYMDKETVKALDESITKWWRILVEGGEDLGGKNCALCKKFAPTNGCIGCPIKQKTERGGCIGSPYDKWSEHLDTHHKGVRKVQCPECVDLARKMHAFLVDLRPERYEIRYTLEEALRLGWRVQKITWRHPLKTELRHTLSNTNRRAGKVLQFWDPRDNYTNVFEPVKTKYWETKDWVVHRDGFYDKPRAFSREEYLEKHKQKNSKETSITVNINSIFNKDLFRTQMEEILQEIDAKTPNISLKIDGTGGKRYEFRKTGIESMVGKVVYRTGPNKWGDDSYTETRIKITAVTDEYIHFDFYSGSIKNCVSRRDTWDDGRWAIDYDKCSYGIETMVGKLAHRTAPTKNKHGDRSRMDSPVRVVDVTPTTIYFKYIKKYDACFGDDLHSLDRAVWGEDWALWPEQY